MTSALKGKLPIGLCLTVIGTEGALDDLALLDTVVDPHTDERAWQETLALADRFRLTLYDAAYLELARRIGLPLATLDQDLRRAATAEGVVLLGS